MLKFKNMMNQEHEGAVAFEYIIILVIMAVCIFAAWNYLGDEVVSKAKQITTFIKNNGQNASDLGGVGHTPG